MEPESLRRRVAPVLVGLETALDAGAGRAAGLGASSPAVETVRRVGFPAAEEPHLHVRAHFFWLHNGIMFEISFYYIYDNDIFLSTQVTFHRFGMSNGFLYTFFAPFEGYDTYREL